MDQADFVRRVSEAPGMFTWLLGAGASQSAGLPTATDVIWDLKRRFYCSEEQQAISANDLQNGAIKEKIDAFMASRGFPSTGDPTAYSRSFELIFGVDHERQRNYLQGILSEKNSSLTLGHRAFAGLIASSLIKIVFTTNFDTVVERALAEVAGKDIAPFHLEGSYAAQAALDHEQFPVYCKLHGDFRYTSLKNLETDLQSQNAELGKCLVNACNRFGLIVAGYSGRDESVMRLLSSVLDGPNPFPHGLYWMGLKGRPPIEPVAELLKKAREKGIRAEWVEIETFDSPPLPDLETIPEFRSGARGQDWANGRAIGGHSRDTCRYGCTHSAIERPASDATADNMLGTEVRHPQGLERSSRRRDQIKQHDRLYQGAVGAGVGGGGVAPLRFWRRPQIACSRIDQDGASRPPEQFANEGLH